MPEITFTIVRTAMAVAGQRLENHGLTNFTTVSSQAESLPFGSEVFDVVFMISVLGEVPDRAAAIKEAARVLRPGGHLSSTEAAGDPDRVKRAELDALATLVDLEKGKSWSGLLVKTFNYDKPAEIR